MNHQEQPDQRFDRINPRSIRTPEPSEANRVAAFLGALRDAGLPEPEGAP